MRIITREELMKMPPGTLFSKTGGKYPFTGSAIHILEEVYPDIQDFVSTELSIYSYDNDDMCKLDDGESVYGYIITERDGYVADDKDNIRFIIYDQLDFDMLMDTLSRVKPEPHIKHTKK